VSNTSRVPDGIIEVNEVLIGSLTYEVPLAQKRFVFTFTNGLFDSPMAWDLVL
jgi:hypothetical protein